MAKVNYLPNDERARRYNATVRTFKNGKLYRTFVAHVETVNGREQMLSANGVTCTGYEGKFLTEPIAELGAVAGDAAYDVYLRALRPDEEIEITLDNCEGYRNAFANMAS